MTTEIVHLLVPCGKPVVMELPATAAAAAAAEPWPVALPPSCDACFVFVRGAYSLGAPGPPIK